MRRALLLLLIGTAAPTAAAAQLRVIDEVRAERREVRAERREAARQERADPVIRSEPDQERPQRVRRAPAERSPAGVERLLEGRFGAAGRLERPASRPGRLLEGRFGGAARPEQPTSPPERRLQRVRPAGMVADVERPSPGVRIIDAPAAGLAELPRPRTLRRDRVARERELAIVDALPTDRPEREAIADVPAPRVIDAPGTRRRTGDSVADWRLRDRGAGTRPELVQDRQGTTPELMRDPVRRRLERFVSGGIAPAVSREPREGTQPPAPVAQRPTGVTANHWRGDWRRDRRYDWHDWRRRHRSRFHFGFYFDPFGWSYRRNLAGWRLWPAYYGSNFWLRDAYYYRLPSAPPGYRWIRYYDDAILVDTWDGRVADVIHDFFW